MANIGRVRAVVEHIENQLARQKSQPVVTNLLSFDMGEWYAETKNVAGEVCGTAMCLAGWAVHSEGLKMYEWEDPEWGSKDIVVGVEGRPTVDSWAAQFFEFTPDEVEIFYYTDLENVEQLKSALNKILEEEVFEGAVDYYSF